MKKKAILYTKSTCPWCHEAIEYFESKDFHPEMRDLNDDTKYREELHKKTGQTSVPTLVYADFSVKDFSVDEFIEEINKHPNIKKELKL